MTIEQQISFLKQQLENPDIPMRDKVDIIEYFQIYNDAIFNNYNWDSFVRDTRKLTDKHGETVGKRIKCAR
jgi:hypothetical protein